MGEFKDAFKGHPCDGEYVVDGVSLKVEVSPCCLMYAGYGLQVSYADGDRGSWGYVHDKSIPIATATREVVQKMLDKALKAEPCQKCGKTHLYNPDPQGNRGHLCEGCFLAQLNAESEAFQAEEAKRVAKYDAKMKAKGCTHKAEAWIHAGGDDKMVDFYFNAEPTVAEIQKILKRRHSKVLTDYVLKAL